MLMNKRFCRFVYRFIVHFGAEVTLQVLIDTNVKNNVQKVDIKDNRNTFN